MAFFLLLLIPFQASAFDFGIHIPLTLEESAGSLEYNGESVDITRHEKIGGYHILLGFSGNYLEYLALDRSYELQNDNKDIIKLDSIFYLVGMLMENPIYPWGFAVGFGNTELTCTQGCNSIFSKSESSIDYVYELKFGVRLNRNWKFMLSYLYFTGNDIKAYNAPKTEMLIYSSTWTMLDTGFSYAF